MVTSILAGAAMVAVSGLLGVAAFFVGYAIADLLSKCREHFGLAATCHLVAAVLAFVAVFCGSGWWVLIIGFVNVGLVALHGIEEVKERKDEAAEAAL
jgi:hypothetical protein